MSPMLCHLDDRKPSDLGYRLNHMTRILYEPYDSHTIMNRMTRRTTRMAAALLLAAAVGCGPAARAPESPRVQPASDNPPTHSSAPAADSVGRPYVAADVKFVSGMIGHHAQAVLIAGWPPTHGASRRIRVLSERILVGQQDEIALMEGWLRKHGETVPSSDSSHHMASGKNSVATDHSALMPGMLSAEQLTQLDRASGVEFDRLFLTFMIQHHRGALVMVDRLFGSQGGGQNESVFKLASDVYADQTTEIERMERMLAALSTQRSTP